MKQPKAYKNSKFLSSPMARTIRILSEFLEPLSRFRKEGISNTIVFFGSSRILPPDVAKKQLQKLKRLHLKSSQLTQSQKNKLEEADVKHTMSIYYKDAYILSAMITKWAKSLPASKHYVVCSGGGPGIMEAANKGAIQAKGIHWTQYKLTL